MAIAAFIRERRVDAISVLVLSGIALSILAFAGGGGVKFLQLRENLVTGLVGLIFLGSAAIGRPLIYQLSRAGVRRRAADKVQADVLVRATLGVPGRGGPQSHSAGGARLLSATLCLIRARRAIANVRSGRFDP